MDPITPPPEPSAKPPDSLPQEIPSVVAAGKRRNTGAIVGVLGATVLLLMLFARGHRQESPVPANNPVAPPAMTPVAPPMAIPETIVRPTDQQKQEDALRQLRGQSPVVLFNKTQATTPAAPESALRSFAPAPAAEPAPPPPASVPLPSGFSPSVATGAQATHIGNLAYTVAKGKVIDAVLETSVNSDEPGFVRAIVSAPVYADRGDVVLLPVGTRLTGEYDSGTQDGQDRVFVLWDRAIRPDGVDIQLGSPGTDSEGQTGLPGKVNTHFWLMFRTSALLSALGAGAATVGVNPADNANSLADYRAGIAKSFSDASNTALSRYLKIKPTIKIAHGAHVIVFVARDLHFESALPDPNAVTVIP